jgi:hypothetical protein
MLVKTPAIKLGVEIREAAVAGDRIAFTGVAGAMPCTVEVTPREVFALAGHLCRPKLLRLMLRGLFPSRKEHTR